MPRHERAPAVPHRSSPYPSSSDRTAVRQSDATGRSSSPTIASSDDPPVPKNHTLVVDDIVTKKGKTKVDKDTDPTLARILQLAQFVRRNVDLWINIPQAMNAGLAAGILKQYELLRETDDNYNEQEKTSAQNVLNTFGKEKDILVKASEGIWALLENEKDYIRGLDDKGVKALWREMNTYADQGRNNDTAGIKAKGHRYVIKDGYADPPIDERDNKSTRGTSHPQLLRMIVPMSFLQEYGKDADFDDKVKARECKITHRFLPAFLYDVEMWDPDEIDAGLFRGHLPVRIVRHIYTGPSSARTAPGSKGRATRPCNAKIAGLTEVTPAMIAYGCVQARFLICKLDTFGDEDEEFNVKAFYYAILKFFEDDESEWVQETLAWWNRQVFGLSDDHKSDRADEDDHEGDDDDDDDTTFAKVLAARKARENEKKQAAAKKLAAANRPAARQLALEVPAVVSESQTQLDSQADEDAFPGVTVPTSRIYKKR